MFGVIPYKSETDLPDRAAQITTAVRDFFRAMDWPLAGTHLRLLQEEEDGEWRKDGRTPAILHQLGVTLPLLAFMTRETRPLQGPIDEEALTCIALRHDSLESWGNGAEEIAAQSRDIRMTGSQREAFLEKKKVIGASIEPLSHKRALRDETGELVLTADNKIAKEKLHNGDFKEYSLNLALRVELLIVKLADRSHNTATRLGEDAKGNPYFTDADHRQYIWQNESLIAVASRKENFDARWHGLLDVLTEQLCFQTVVLKLATQDDEPPSPAEIEAAQQARRRMNRDYADLPRAFRWDESALERAKRHIEKHRPDRLSALESLRQPQERAPGCDPGPVPG